MKLRVVVAALIELPRVLAQNEAHDETTVCLVFTISGQRRPTQSINQ